MWPGPTCSSVSGTSLTRPTPSSGPGDRYRQASLEQSTGQSNTIPGFMGAMAMPYMFKDSVALSKLKVGDHITGDLVVTGGKTLVDNVVVDKGATGAMKKDSTKKS